MLLSPKGRLARLCLSLCFAASSFGLHAQSNVTPEDEYRKLIRVDEDIHPLGENPFGENVSLYNGTLSFDQTDLSLGGDGPAIEVERSFHLRELKESESIDGAFSDWDLELPRITTVTANQANVTGWQVRNSADADARCSHFGAPPTVMAQQGGSDWEPHSWWAGYQLVVPGQGSQDLLKRVAENVEAPQMSGMTFSIVTKNHWMVSCLAATDGSAPGEAFLAVAPDGTKYWFTHMVYRWASTIHRPIGSDPMGQALPRLHADPRLMVASSGDILPQALNQIMAAMPAVAMDDFLRRRTASLLVTKVEDRFGNTLTYSYDGNNVIAITASDGRKVVFGYEVGTNRVTSVTLQPASGSPRTWSYQYNADARHTLNRVVLPDGSAWSYQLSNFLYGEIDTTEGTCDGSALISDAVQTGTITHPSGLVGSFQVKPIIRGRSYVLKQCITTPDDPMGYALVPRTYTQYSILSKTFSGAGLPTRTWQYGYSPSNESWSSDCTSGCVSTVWTDVTGPDGAATRYTFSNRFDVSEGQLLRTDFYSGAPGSNVLRSVVNTYASSAAGPWPSRYGSNLQSRMNAAVLEQAAPLSKRVMTQESTNYTWEAEAFNEYAQVTQVRRYSSIAGQAAVQEKTDYLNDPLLWVLGLPTQVTNLTTGEVVDRNVYDPSHDTLAERWHFGQKLMTYAFNAQGQLASFTDGNGHTTTLGSYKRGIPQTIGYPDSTSQSLVVDDFGQIQSITDQAGATTSYGYDAIGRLARIDYPSGDEQAWYPKTFTYSFVTAAERGVGANHWRRTVAKGNQRQVTYFNAELQPVLTDTFVYGDANSHSNVRGDYDYRGLTTFSSYPAAGQPNLTDLTTGMSSTYDALGRLIRTQQTSELGTLTTTIAYLSGARKQVTDPKAKVTTTSYQVFDQPSYDTVIQVAAPTGLSQTIARDLYGNPLSITQAGPYGTGTVSLTKTLTYDAFHRLCRTTEPESGSEVMAYDGANNLAWSAAGLSLTGSDCGLDQVADAGKTVRTYDAMNRLWTVAPPAGTQGTTYGYDALGNLKSAISGITTWSATRNKLGQLTGETLQVTGQDPWHVSYGHDAYGSLKRLTYPDGEILDYAPDALGRPTQVGGYAGGIQYFPNGEVASFSYGNGASYLAEQNARQLLSNFSYGVGGALNLSEDYSYDANGNITNVTDLVDGRRTKAFGYDDLNRLTSATASNLWGTEGYTYDPLNNIRTRVGNGATYTYNYDALNRLASITGAATSSFGYDSRGNVTSKSGSTLQFDQKNQLSQIDGLASYAYDAAGRRVLKTTAGGASTYFFYNQAGQVLQSYDATSNLVTSYMRLGTKLVARNSLLLVVPDPLTTINAPAIAGASFVVSWSTSDNAANYVLEQSKDGGGWSLAYQGLSTSVTLYPTANGNYVYRVKACNVKGCSDYAQSGIVEVTLPPTAAPTISIPASTSTGNYSVSWNAVAAATTYTLQTQVNGGAWALTQQGGALNRSVSDAGNGTYGYRVRAENKGGYGPWSGVGTIDVKRIPVAPNAPSISVGGNEWKPVFTVSWNAVPWATSYQAEEVGQDTIQFYDGPNTSASLMVLDEGMVQFHVRACSVYGCSSWSPYTTHGGSAPTGTPTISVPTGSSTGSYTVSWTAVSMASSYKLQEQVNGGTWTSITNTTATSTTISGKANGQYGYRVMACNANGCGPVSAAKTITVGIIPPTPAAPHVSVSGVDYKQVVKASWTAVAGATSYNVEMTEPGATLGEVYSAGSNTYFSTITFDPGTYKFRVQACNSVGCSGWSAYGSATVVSGL